MSKLFLLILLTSCASKNPVNSIRKPASIFMEQYNVPGGSEKFKELIMSYGREIQKTLKAPGEPADNWFKLCGKKSAPKNFTLKDALECHDQFASQYFMDINHLDILVSIDKSDYNSVINNFYVYPAIVFDYYFERIKTLP